MSGTSGMLTALAAFNNRNTTSFYPELYRIKMLILNANKRGSNVVNTSYTSVDTNTNTHTYNILKNLQLLFPGIYINYSKINNGLPFYVFSPSDLSFTTQNNITNNFYISQTAAVVIDASGTFAFTYTSGNAASTPMSTNQAPFITTSGVAVSISSALTGTPGTIYASGSASIPANTNVTVTVTIRYSSIPTVDFGISFNNTNNGSYVNAFKTWLKTANNLTTNVPTLTLTNITNVPLATSGYQFAGLSGTSLIPRVVINAIPIIRQNTSLIGCFSECTNFNSNISGWDTSAVTTMANCFSGCSDYNNGSQALNWNTSKVTSMASCFSGCTAFNSNISTWNTSKVTDMSFMFFNASSFNQAITYNMESQYWNTSAVTTIANIFACILEGGEFNNGGSSMNWILTGLSGQPLTALMVTQTSSSIYNWRGGYQDSADQSTAYAALTFANAPVLLTTGSNTAFL
jgi:surface protein